MKERESTDSIKRSASGDGCVHSLPGLQRMVGEVMRGLEDLWGLETWLQRFSFFLEDFEIKISSIISNSYLECDVFSFLSNY